MEVLPRRWFSCKSSFLLPPNIPCALVHQGCGDIVLRASYTDNSITREHLLWLCAPEQDTLVGMGEIGDGGVAMYREDPERLAQAGVPQAKITELRNKSLFPHPFFKQIDQVFEQMTLQPLLRSMKINYRRATTADIFEDHSQLVAMSGIYQRDGDTGTSGAYLFIVHNFIRSVTAYPDLEHAIAAPFNKHGQVKLYHLHTTRPISPAVMALPQVNQGLKAGIWPLLYREVGGNWSLLPWDGSPALSSEATPLVAAGKPFKKKKSPIKKKPKTQSNSRGKTPLGKRAKAGKSRPTKRK